MPSEKPAATNITAYQDLDEFLASVEKRALRMADIAVRNPDDAMDIVQDAMLTLAKRYGGKPAEQWAPLFYRILQNRIRDWHRRGKVRNRLFTWFSKSDEAGNLLDPADTTAGPQSYEPEHRQQIAGATLELEIALTQLPNRQREAFMLRAWEGLDVAQTALAMGCSAGSVKTHYSRAVHRLREQLEEHWHDRI